jgi:hypothetical protein
VQYIEIFQFSRYIKRCYVFGAKAAGSEADCVESYPFFLYIKELLNDKKFAVFDWMSVILMASGGTF